MKILDIGTHLGTSARTMLDFSDDEDIVTFDVNEWTSYSTTYLTEEDFSSGKLVQHRRFTATSDVCTVKQDAL